MPRWPGARARRLRWCRGTNGKVEWFRWVRAPTTAKLTELTHTLAERVGRFLQRQGLLECDGEQRFLAAEAVEEGAMDQLIGHSITYRIAVGPQAGRKVFTLQTLPASEEPFDGPVGQVAGFSLHAGVAAKAHQRQKLERLCRYISRPAVSEQRLSLTPNGNVRYQLKTPYRDGTTHVIFEPLDFTAPAHPAPAALVHPCTSSPGSPRWCPSPG